MNVKPILLVVLILFAFSVNISQVESQQSLDVTVQADRTQYMELVSIAGNVTYQGELVQNGLIGIQVENHPLDTSQVTTIVIRTLPLNSNQSFPFSIEIVCLLPVDENGDPKPSANRGNYIWFNMTVKNKGLSTREVYLCITILDRRLIPLGVEMAILMMPGGATNTFMPRVYIPRWATVGTAYICANVYDSWPKDRGHPLCPEKVSNFNIEQPSSTSPNQPAQNGTYETYFRLRPDMAWGTCRVYALARSGGYTGFSTANFEYWLPGDFDEDCDVDLYDAVGLLKIYGSKEGQPKYNSTYDIAEPYGIINLYDAVLMLAYYGTKVS
jgi:hypothetical protein